MEKAVEEQGAEHAQNSMLLCEPGALISKALDPQTNGVPGKAIPSCAIDICKIFNMVVMDFEHSTWKSNNGS